MPRRARTNRPLRHPAALISRRRTARGSRSPARKPASAPSRRRRIARRRRAPTAGSVERAGVSALVRTADDLHRVGDVAPLLGLIGLAAALASPGLFGGLCDRRKTMLFQHLARYSVDLDLGHHGRSPV